MQPEDWIKRGDRDFSHESTVKAASPVVDIVVDVLEAEILCGRQLILLHISRRSESGIRCEVTIRKQVINGLAKGISVTLSFIPPVPLKSRCHISVVLHAILPRLNGCLVVRVIARRASARRYADIVL